MLQAIGESVFEQGVSAKLLIAINVIFCALILTGLLVSIFITFSYHVVLLMVLGIALIVTINWFVCEMGLNEVEKEAKTQ